MKTAFIVTITLLMVRPIHAQDAPNFNEWFRQKKTQIKYLVQQIAALQVYLGYLKKGYQIVDNGLTTIGNIKDGTLTQDQTYLNSLKSVSPVVRDSPQVGRVLLYQKYILTAFIDLRGFVLQNAFYTEAEREYIQSVQTNILNQCQDSLNELGPILTVGETEMTDDDRLQRLDKVHEEMLDRYSFTRGFVASTRLLALQRAKENQEINTLKRIHEM
jgi:hypothetical protein